MRCSSRPHVSQYDPAQPEKYTENESVQRLDSIFGKTPHDAVHDGGDGRHGA